MTRVLYKFMPTEFALPTLQRRLVKLTSAAEANDPFELHYRVRNTLGTKCRDFFGPDLQACFNASELPRHDDPALTSDQAAFVQEIPRMLVELEARFRSAGSTQQEFLDQTMSADNDALAELLSLHQRVSYLLCLAGGIESTAMWGTYAAKHTGIAIGFREGAFSVPVDPVQYTDELPVFEVEVFRLFEQDVLSRTAAHRSTYLTKGSSWRYENEHRSFIYRDDAIEAEGLSFLGFDPKHVEHVVLGSRFDQCVERDPSEALHDLEDLVRRDPDYSGLRIVPSRRSETHFRIEI